MMIPKYLQKLSSGIFLGTNLTNQNSIHEELKSILKSGNVCLMGITASEVGYTSVTTGRGDH
jgi:hypothetical protein